MIGEQKEKLADACVWVLPNPSGLNANYQLPELVCLFRKLRRQVGSLQNRERQRADAGLDVQSDATDHIKSSY